MLIPSLSRHYENILTNLKKAENALEEDNQDLYLKILINIKTSISQTEKLIQAWTEKNDSLALNLKLLNNYYKHLLTQALEENNKSSIAELKYHLLELIESCNFKFHKSSII